MSLEEERVVSIFPEGHGGSFCSLAKVWIMQPSKNSHPWSQG